MIDGAAKRETRRYELALFVAWHTAAFTVSAKAGKLKEFSHYRAKLVGKSETATTMPQDWRDRKRERQQQMEMLKKHRAQRTRQPLRKPHG